MRRRVAEQLPLLQLLDITFLCQAYSDLHTLEKPRHFVIPAEGTDSIDNLIDFLQGLSVHNPVEFLEVGFDGCVIEATRFGAGIEQHLQKALGNQASLATGWPDEFGGQS